MISSAKLNELKLQVDQYFSPSTTSGAGYDGLKLDDTELSVIELIVG
jgi:hypothetical protein